MFLIVKQQLGSHQRQLGKTAVVKTGAYIVSMDRKTTVYRLHFDEASNMFAELGVNVTFNGRSYLGIVIGSQEYVEEYMSSKV